MSDEQFRLFVAEHGDAVARYVRRRVRPCDCDGVISEVFLVAWRRFAHIPSGRERAWLYGVARRVIANTARGDLRRSLLSDRLIGLRPHAAVDAFEVVSAHLGVLDPRLHTAMMALSADEREILLLVAWESLSPSELAVALSVSEAAARKRLSRARSHARELYESPEQRYRGGDG